jgi:hypothetical protein
MNLIQSVGEIEMVNNDTMSVSSVIIVMMIDQISYLFYKVTSERKTLSKIW